MTTAALEGRTKYEATEYARDHGRTAAIAVGQQCYARHLHACAAEDMEILGLHQIPEPRPQTWPVTGGTDEDRKGRVDAWAKRHGVKAGTDPDSGTYRAVLAFGPVQMVVYMIPDLVLADRLAGLYGTLQADRDALAQAEQEPAA